MSTPREFQARGIVRGTASGVALVSDQAISFLGDIDIRSGEVVGTLVTIRGASVAGRVLVIPDSVGSAGSWRFLYQLSVHGTAPAAIVQRTVPDSSLVQGAILANVPVVCEPDTVLFSVIASGDRVVVDATCGTIRVTPGGGTGGRS